MKVLYRAAICLALAAAQPLFAQEQRLSRVEAFIFANQLLTAGQPAAARAISLTLVRLEPENPETWMQLAQAERALGQTEASRAAARNARRFAKTDLQLYNAAILLADSFIQEKRFTRAQVWLRRARQAAPNAALKARVAQDYKRVDRVNPLRYNFDFSLAPSSNINNGSREDTAIFFFAGIPLEGSLSLDAQALSGYEARVAAVAYDKNLGKGRSYTLSARTDIRRYRFSSETKDDIDDARDAGTTEDLPDVSDYAYDYFSVGGTYRFPITKMYRGESTLTFGRLWYGGDPLARDASLMGSLVWSPTTREARRAYLRTTRRERSDTDTRSSTTWELGYIAVFAPESGSRWVVSTSFSDTNAQSPTEAHQRAALNVSYTFAQPLWGTQVTTSLGVSVRRDDEPSFDRDPRVDRGTNLGATFFLRDQEIYGFAPTISLTAERTDSNLSRYQTEEIGISFGLRSVF